MTLRNDVKTMITLNEIVNEHDTVPLDGINRKYNGCKNCKHQIEPLRMCEWAETGGDGRMHLVCPKWEFKY